MQASVSEGRSGMEWQPTAQMLSGRRDFRSETIFTIDPTTARDLDDALGISQLPDKSGVRVSVHIADVSHFVLPSSDTDVEAQNRCTTVYLVDRVIPMLPRPLCEVACSLNEGVEVSRMIHVSNFCVNGQRQCIARQRLLTLIWYSEARF